MNQFLVYPNLVFGPHVRHKLDLFVPQNILNPPFVILIHGGGWAGGSKEQYRQTALLLAEAGIACATIGYRLIPDAVWPEIVFDVMKGIEFLCKNSNLYKINATKAVTWGSSAGGHSALVIQAWRDKWLKEGVVAEAPEIIGVIAQCPVVRFEKPFPEIERRKIFMNGYPHEEVCPINMDPKLFKNIFVHQGDKDDTTPIEAAIQFVNQVKSSGNIAELLTIPETGHGYGYNTLSKESQLSIEMAIPYIFNLFKNSIA